jgi:hypothetical protein
MKTIVLAPANFESKLDELVKLSEKYGVAAARNDLVQAEELMGKIKASKAAIVRDVEKKTGETYSRGVDDGRMSVKR